MNTVEKILALADGYASHLQACNFDDADEFRAALLAAVEELYDSLAKDAERYRFLRSLMGRQHEKSVQELFDREPDTAEELDELIDIAMKGQS